MLDLKKLLSKILNAPFIVEQGTSGMWTYRKWSDGIAECWGVKTQQVTLASWGSWYYVRIAGEAYPTDLFTTMVSVDGSLGVFDYDVVSGVGNRPSAWNKTAPNIIGIRPTAISGTKSATAFWHAIGKWK